MASHYFDEFVDPTKKGSFVIRAEHYMRYIFAKKYLENHSKSKSVIYDIGCGNGYGSKFLPDKYNYLGFDVSEDLISDAKSKSQNNTNFFTINFDTTDLVAFIKQQDLPKPQAVVCFETLEHLNSPKKLLQQLANILPENGIILFSVPNAKYEPKRKGKPRNIFHKHLFEKDDITNLFSESGFVVTEWYGQPYTNSLLHFSKRLVKLLDILSSISFPFFTVLAYYLALPKKDALTASYSFIGVAKKVN